MIEINVRLVYSSAWTFGGGTSLLQIGYCPIDTPALIVNFIVLGSLSLTTAGNFYQQTFTGLDLTFPVGSAMACRIVNTGISSTSNQAELFVSAVVH